MAPNSALSSPDPTSLELDDHSRSVGLIDYRLFSFWLSVNIFKVLNKPVIDWLLVEVTWNQACHGTIRNFQLVSSIQLVIEHGNCNDILANGHLFPQVLPWISKNNKNNQFWRTRWQLIKSISHVKEQILHCKTRAMCYPKSRKRHSETAIARNKSLSNRNVKWWYFKLNCCRFSRRRAVTSVKINDD